MALLKCKMCGGSLEVSAGETIIECEYCGTQQTLPKTTDESIQALFNRANLLRQKNEFDKAEAVYEKILEADDTEAEAYWGVILCKFGIEYVEDPKTYKRIPTCHRTSYDSIVADEYYKRAIENAVITQRTIYEAEAKKIDEIQKGILAISAQEDPYDVFICYKETDESGRRTQDSVMANDIYYQLTQEGFKVFYAAITLEDKLGSAYEPIIFAALNSSKVMLSIGTKPEYFSAVWVKNEWSRFLKMMKNDRSKMLIPCYKGMDAYELPEEFAHLQAQDMGKIGFINDIVRGIKKVIVKDEPKTTVVKETVVTSANPSIDPLLKRAFMFLEDSKWSEANEYFEKVLDSDPECADGYLGKLLAELKVQCKKNLEFCSVPFDHIDNYNKVIRFGDEALVSELKQYNIIIRDRNEENRKKGIYNAALELATHQISGKQLAAAEEFEKISGYRDSDDRAKECLAKAQELAEIERKDAIYAEALDAMKESNISSIEDAIKKFQSIITWKDSENKIAECNKKIENIKDQQEQKRIADEKAAKKRKKIIAISTPCVCLFIVFIIILNTIIIPNSKYNNAMDAIASGNYIAAYEGLQELGDYKDSIEQMNNIKDNYYVALIKNASVGDIVKFGTYEQDNDTNNGKEYLEWKVLAKEGNKVLLYSTKIIDKQPYHSDDNDVTWKDSTLRTWLNSTFLNSAFNSIYQAKICSTNLNDTGTEDKIFLLNEAEITKYFPNKNSRVIEETSFAGWLILHYWLRTPDTFIINLENDSDFDLGGTTGTWDKNTAKNGIRPAIWVEVE